MIINNNIPALNTHRMLTTNNAASQKAMEKLSSGLRINRAGDDAAGLAISEKMRGQIRGLDMASRNAQDGISLIQTAEGALNESHSILQRMRELAVQSSNGTYNEVDRSELQKEMNELLDEIDRIASDTEFNTKTLLDGSFKEKFHIGANEGQSIELSIESMATANIGEGKGYEADSSISLTEVTDTDDNVTGYTLSGNSVTINGTDITLDDSTEHATKEEALAAFADAIKDSGVKAELDDDGSTINLVSDSTFQHGTDDTDASEITTGSTINNLNVDPEEASDGGILTQEDADEAITAINNAIETVSAERSKMGAYQNRLEHTINNLGTSAENLQAAESRIRDVDYAPAA